MKRKPTPRAPIALPRGYDGLIKGIAHAIQAGRRQAAWNLNAIMTAVYWEIGRRIVDFEQQGAHKAEYGERVILLLSKDLTARFGRGFRQSNLYQIRAFYLAYPHIFQTPSGKFDPVLAKKFQTVSGKLAAPSKDGIFPVGKTVGAQLTTLTAAFTLAWSHYARLLTVKHPQTRGFYEAEAFRGGWSVRQLDRQIATQLYERTALSRDKAAMLKRGARQQAEDRLTPEEEIKDAYVLEFLNLIDEAVRWRTSSDRKWFKWTAAPLDFVNRLLVNFFRLILDHQPRVKEQHAFGEPVRDTIWLKFTTRKRGGEARER